MPNSLVNKLFVLPHQDDEIFCYSQLDSNSKVVIVFKGGGEPKGYTMPPDELYKARCMETLRVCGQMSIQDVVFLAVQRPYTNDILDTAIKKLLDKEEYDIIFTTMEEDNHPDHKALSGVVLKYATKPVLGFIVQTNMLISYANTHPPNVEVRLTDTEYAEKVSLVDEYVTQKHFLPNVIRRGAYKTEKYWRLD